MNKALKIITLLVLGFFLFYSDFIRDYVFKNLEYQIYYLNHISPEGVPTVLNYTDSWMETFLEGKSIENIVNLKWIFTLLFTIYFYAFCVTIPYILYKKKVIFKFTSILYAVLFLSALTIYGLKFLSNDYKWQENTYLIALGIMHFLQSSLPTILMVISFKLHLSFNSKEEEK